MIRSIPRHGLLTAQWSRRRPLQEALQ
jgi:hypothetical protein